MGQDRDRPAAEELVAVDRPGQAAGDDCRRPDLLDELDLGVARAGRDALAAVAGLLAVDDEHARLIRERS